MTLTTSLAAGARADPGRRADSPRPTWNAGRRGLQARARRPADRGRRRTVTVYHFTGWSDGGAIRHFVTTPAADRDLDRDLRPVGSRSPASTSPTPNLAGPPVLTRADSAGRLHLVDGLRPAPACPPTTSRPAGPSREAFAAGRYRFTIASDDGARLFIDDELVIDQWHDQGPTAYDYVADLAAGEHSRAAGVLRQRRGREREAVLGHDAGPAAGDVFTAEYWNTPGAGSAPTVPATRSRS